VGTRRSYVVDDPSGGHAADICGTVFDVLESRIEALRVDAYSDFNDQMPDDIRAAQEWLRARGLTQGEVDPGIGIAIDRDDEIGWAIARAYSPWSIHTTLYDRDGVTLANLGDGGHSVTLNLTDAEVADLRAILGRSAALVLLSELDDRKATS
jgi:hypothetical protein